MGAAAWWAGHPDWWLRAASPRRSAPERSGSPRSCCSRSALAVVFLPRIAGRRAHDLHVGHRGRRRSGAVRAQLDAAARGGGLRGGVPGRASAQARGRGRRPRRETRPSAWRTTDVRAHRRTRRLPGGRCAGRGGRGDARRAWRRPGCRPTQVAGRRRRSPPPEQVEVGPVQDEGGPASASSWGSCFTWPSCSAAT